jgi:hypothetical protein
VLLQHAPVFKTQHPIITRLHSDASSFSLPLYAVVCACVPAGTAAGTASWLTGPSTKQHASALQAAADDSPSQFEPELTERGHGVASQRLNSSVDHTEGHSTRASFYRRCICGLYVQIPVLSPTAVGSCQLPWRGSSFAVPAIPFCMDS